MQTTPGTPREPDLAGLATRVRAGDPQALGDWYRLEHPRVWRLALAFLADVHDADDLAQDAMLRLADRLPQWDPTRPYAPWRTRLVLNMARDLRRRRAARAAVALPELPSRLPSPVGAAAAEEVRGLVQAALAQLPEREREAFVLRDLEGWETDAAAEAMGIGASSVRALLTLARRRLRALLEPRLRAAEAEGSRV